MNNKNKVAMLIPYFGNWPKWFGLYLYTCSKNSCIDFFFFTDCKIPSVTYNNTIFLQMSFTDYCNNVSEQLGISFSPQSPYKLCDLKPFYGIIHKDILNNYDYWGFGDIDLIYGNLYELLLKDHLYKYDLLTTHTYRVAGHFTLIRTNSKYTTLCLDIPNWKDKLVNPDHFGIDESDFSKLVKPIHLKIFDKVYNRIISKVTSSDYLFIIYYYYYLITKLIPSKVLMKEMFTTFVPNLTSSCIFNLKDISITCDDKQKTRIKGKSIPYLHFLFFKKTEYLHTNDYWRENFYMLPEEYDFSKGGILEISTKHIELKSI